MILTLTKIELISYSKLLPFIRFNSLIVKQLKKSRCKKYKVSNDWNFKAFYTMTLWENENDINEFYRTGDHLIAMKQSKRISSKIQSKRLIENDLINWNDAKKIFTT